MPHAQITLPAATRSVGDARRFLLDTLEEWDAEPFVWIAATVISELTTNAVLHARTSFTVAVAQLGDRLRLEVADGSVRRPVPRRYGLEATTGRGLALVQQLARSWGVTTKGNGKTVWCEIMPEPSGAERGGADELEMPDAAEVDALLASFGEDYDDPDQRSIGSSVGRARVA